MPLPAGSLPVPPKRINERVMEQMVDVPVPQMKEENGVEPVVEAVRLVPKARVQRFGEHIVDVPDDAGETDRMYPVTEIEEKVRARLIGCSCCWRSTTLVTLARLIR